jgi:hypothetical protein
MNIHNAEERKSNIKTWTCPLDGKTMNRRGAPAYLRNKYGITWDNKFLENPYLINNRLKPEIYTDISSFLNAFFFKGDIENTESNRRTITVITILISRLKSAMVNNNHQMISLLLSQLEVLTRPIK